MAGLQLPTFVLLLIIIAIILITGTFVDVSPAILLLTPVFLPAAVSLGMDPIQFGALLIAGLAVGLVTPPVGMCLNVASVISKLSIGKIFKGALPFLLANVATLLLITYFKPLTLWLPSLMK
jgi:TRAP-type C4-dicarboxylate transport system permease large subunit